MAEWNAGDYSRQSQLQAAMADEELSRLTLAGGERILDVGCGDGKVTAVIAARVPGGSVLGVDPSQNMIAFAASHFGPPAHPNLRFAVADARTLPYRGEFDLVVSFNALHWVPDQAAALRSIRAALAPTGRTLLRMVPEGPRRCLEDVIEEVRHSPRWADAFPDTPRPYAHFTPAEYRALSEAAGLRVLGIRTEDKAWEFQTREAFVAFCRATFAEWTRFLSERDWPAFIADALDRYRPIAADRPEEANTFKFYQMEVVLTPADGASAA
jgi:trans-aconitate methyltransferase